MIGILTIVLVLISLMLVFVILIQSGKGAMQGATFGAGQQLFGGSGGKTFFTRATAVLAAAFVVVILFIAVLQQTARTTSPLQRKLKESVQTGAASGPAPAITIVAGTPMPGVTPPVGGNPLVLMMSPVVVTPAPKK